MKKRLPYLFKCLAFLLGSVVAAQAQIPTTYISGTQTFTSLSSIDADTAYIPGTAVEDMVTVNVTEIFNNNFVNTSGIDATFSTSVNNPTTTLSTAPDPSATIYNGGIIIVKVYSFNRAQPGGKGPLVFGMYSTQTSSSGTFLRANWGANRITSNKSPSSTFKSDQIRKGTNQLDDYYYLNTPNCEQPNTKGGWVSPGGIGYSFDCYYHKGKNRLQPVIVEVTIKSATLRAINLPGVGVITAQYFPVQNPSNVVAIKGSNYEINTLSSSLPFGHAVGGAANRFTISNVNTDYQGAKFTGLFGSAGSINAYIKATVNSGQELLVALENGETLTSASLGSSGFTPTLSTSSAFKIKDAVDGVDRTFNIWKVVSTSSLRIFKFAANRSGPFIIANAFDVNFKQNTTLPAANRKLFNRPDWLNEVIVCAHRGLWSKTGQPGNGSDIPQQLNGIAENTIAAYEAAINTPGIDWIEFDARRTSDGVFIAWHDPDVWRITNKFDNRDCIPLEEVNQRTKAFVVANHGSGANKWTKQVKEYAWNEISNLHMRDYLGCKVKDTNDNYVNPLQLVDALQWVNDQAAIGKYTSLSIDFKDGLNYIDELYKLILEKDLEGQVLFSVYAKDYSLADYQKEYGVSFLRQLPLKPTFYEPIDAQQQYGGDLPGRVKEYVEARNNGHTICGITINVNNDQEELLINLIRQTNPPAFPPNEMWYISHYLEPFMVSIYDSLPIASTADCNETLHPNWLTCSNLFWRGDFDWLLNNGTNGVFSDNPGPLIEYLKAKGKKQ